MSDDFVRDLEDELVAAARFRAAHPARPFPLPRPWVARPQPRRLLLGGLAASAAVALVIAAVLGVSRGGEQRISGEPPLPGVAFALPAMLPPPACDVEPVLDRETAERLPPMAIFARAQQEPDGMRVARDVLPVTAFVPHESRRPGLGELKTEMTLVPARGVRPGGGCPGRGDDDPGLCIVAATAQPPLQRCFTAPDVAAGRAAVRTGDSLVAGVVPDGIAEVTLTFQGRSVTAPVVENAYEAVVPGIPPGAQVELALATAEDARCGRQVAPELLDRVAALRVPAEPDNPLPLAAMETLNWWTWQLDAIVPQGARHWGSADGVDFWVVPVVPKGGGRCTPATHVCVVAVPRDAAADAQCVLERPAGGARWRLGPLLPRHAVIYGVVPDGVDAADVTIGDKTARVEAGQNIIGGVLPFPYRDGARTKVELTEISPTRRPRVAVVDAGGPAGAVNRQLAEAGYPTVEPARSAERAGTVVEWWADRTTWATATEVAELVGADDVVERDPTARTIRSDVAPITVIVGSR